MGGAEQRSEPVLASLAATGGSATAEAASVGDARRHRRLRPSNRTCYALVKEKGPWATRQGARVIGDNSLTKNDTANSEVSESAQEQCWPSGRRNGFGMWGIFLELIFGGMASHCSNRLPEFWWNFWRSVDMNFTKFGKSGSNLQQAKFENFELWTSGS